MAVSRHRYVLHGWGVGELWVDEGVVLAHDVWWAAGAATEPPPPRGGASAPTGTIAEKPSPERDAFVSDLLRRVHRQLRGAPTSFADVPLDLSWCTPLQHALAGALQAVPWGEVVSYGELAALAGRPRAPRAAGSFCAENRFALFLPCHRVVAADGIGGYGSAGVGLKRRLLALEGVDL
ncbi:MAG TPA: methylated-DNA--[protein]-cysteine S-methyltransferase [Gaiellaceae bacterium]